MSQLNRRQVLASAAGAVAWPVFEAQAQSFPDRPMRIVVPFAPGGGADTWSRLIGQRLSQELGQPVIMDSRPGASGVIGSRFVAKSAPADGYTLLFGTGTNITAGPLAMKNPGFDFASDLMPVSGLSLQPLFVVVPAASPYRNLGELIEAGRKEGGKFNYGSTGNGSLTHFAGIALNNATRSAFVHVPYKGGAPLALALIGGEVNYSFMIGNDAMPHVRSGKLRLLAVAAPQRSRFVPDVPTVRESGYPEFPNLMAWFAYFVRAGTPTDIVALLNRKMGQILGEAPMQARLEQTLAEPWVTTPAELNAALRAEAVFLGAIIKSAGIALD